MQNGIETHWMSSAEKTKQKERYLEVLHEIARDEQNWSQLEKFISDKIAFIKSRIVMLIINISDEILPTEHELLDFCSQVTSVGVLTQFLVNSDNKASKYLLRSKGLEMFNFTIESAVFIEYDEEKDYFKMLSRQFFGYGLQVVEAIKSDATNWKT